jgi:hypothetical protein
MISSILRYEADGRPFTISYLGGLVSIIEMRTLLFEDFAGGKEVQECSLLALEV